MTLAEIYRLKGYASEKRSEHLHRALLLALATPVSKYIVSKPWLAEQFMFDSNPRVNLDNLMQNKSLTLNQVLRSTILVAEPTWVEYDVTNDMKCGVLVDNIDGQTHLVFVVNTQDGYATPIGHMTSNQLPTQTGESVRVSWWLNPEEEEDNLVQWFIDAIACLFMICTPRASDIRVVSPSRQVKRCAVRRGELPPVEYKTVRMIAGRGNPRYVHDQPSGENQNPSRDIQHRRLHRVIGHFRNYTKNRDNPLLAFVPEHWRGDAELGIVLHERYVEEDKS